MTVENYLTYYILVCMRIIAGKLGGRLFTTPKSNRTHPMSDKVRGALFNSLGNIDGLTLLDAFAGSGALSFEAISRGAAYATAVDSDKSAVVVMQESANKLDIQDQCKVIRANISSWSDNNPDARFDIVVVDPPYDRLQSQLLQKLVRHLGDSGMFILSWPGKLDLPSFEGLGLKDAKQYGDAQIAFYQAIT